MAGILGGVLGAFPQLASAAALTRYFQTLDVQDSASAGSLTYALPANTLDTDEDALLIFAAWIRVTAGAGARLTFGGTTILSGFDPNVAIFGVFHMVRLGSASQRWGGFYLAGSSVGGVIGRTTSAIDLTAAQNLVADWTAGNADRDATLLAVHKLRRA